MMKLARVTCPGCKALTEQAIEDEQYFLKCSACGQQNSVPDQSPHISGRCPSCGLPFDHRHEWMGDVVIRCLGR